VPPNVVIDRHLKNQQNYKGGTEKVKENISQKATKSKGQIVEVREQFTGSNLTRFGGAGLIRRFFRRHNVEQILDRNIRIEGRRRGKYSVSKLLVSCLYGMLLGYSRPYQMKTLRADKVFQKIVGFCSFPVQSTISRFLSSVRVSVAHQIGALNFDLIMKLRKRYKGYREITLDLDSHVIPVYGDQQRAATGYNPKKRGRKSYHPLVCFVGETRDYIGGMLRSGKHHSSYGCVEFIKGVVRKLPSHIKRIRLRADSGFFNTELIKYLVKESIEFAIVVPMQPWVQRKIQHMTSWTSIGWGIGVGQCDYIVNSNTTLRMVVVRQRVRANRGPRKQLRLLNIDEVKYDYQVIVTNSGKSPEGVWHFYNQRACCENFIKEGIYSLGLDKVVSHRYAGNCTWFELLMLGYNLMNTFKEEVLNHNRAKAMICTIRERLFLIPGKLVHTARRWVLKLEATWAYREEYEQALARVG